MQIQNLTRTRVTSPSYDYNRFITIGRPGYTELVQEAYAQRVRNANLDPDHFILGREVEFSTLSSTVARRALRAIDRPVLATCLQQSVCEWCLVELMVYGNSHNVWSMSGNSDNVCMNRIDAHQLSIRWYS